LNEIKETIIMPNCASELIKRRVQNVTLRSCTPAWRHNYIRHTRQCRTCERTHEQVPTCQNPLAAISKAIHTLAVKELPRWAIVVAEGYTEGAKRGLLKRDKIRGRIRSPWDEWITKRVVFARWKSEKDWCNFERIGALSPFSSTPAPWRSPSRHEGPMAALHYVTPHQWRGERGRSTARGCSVWMWAIFHPRRPPLLGVITGCTMRRNFSIEFGRRRGVSGNRANYSRDDTNTTGEPRSWIICDRYVPNILQF